MNSNNVVKFQSESNCKVIEFKSTYSDFSDDETIPGVQKNTRNNKKEGCKSEVFPFQIADIKKMVSYFDDNDMGIYKLLFVMSLNMARRIGDMLSLKWEHIFNPSTGKMRKELLEIKEQKTDKLANPLINAACKQAIEHYIESTKVNPTENNYTNYIFIQTKGNYKGNRLTADAYRKTLKKAAVAVGIDYNVGTHSTRKTFGMLSRMLHPGDYDSMELLQTIYNHSDAKTTKSYIGLTRQKVDAYYNDMADFFNDYIVGDKTYEKAADTPIVSLDTNDLRDIITAAYKAGQENIHASDSIVHIEAINRLMSMIENLKK